MIHHILDLVIRIFQKTICTSNHSKNSCSFPLRPGEITHARMHFPSFVVSTTCFFFLSSFDVSKTRSAHSWSLDYEWMAQSIHGRRLKKKERKRRGAPHTHTPAHLSCCSYIPFSRHSICYSFSLSPWVLVRSPHSRCVFWQWPGVRGTPSETC